MRPINLIPPEQRRASDGALRTGPAVYLIVGTLAVLLIGIVALVVTSNQVGEREHEVAQLTVEKDAATAKAQQLSAYISFNQVAEQRTATIAQLADQRFDWVRVIRELSLTLPGDVYLTLLQGSAGGGAGGEGISGGVSGPSLTLIGCASGQAGVAGFIATVKQIDGVTRIGLNSSAVAEEKIESASGPAGDVCAQSGKAVFQMVVAFDEAPPSPDSLGALDEVGSTEEGQSSEGGSAEGEAESDSEGESSEGGAEGAPTEPGAAETETAPEASGTSTQASTATTGATG